MTIFEILNENGKDFPWFTLDGWDETDTVDDELIAFLHDEYADWTDTLKIIDHGAWLEIEDTEAPALTRTVGFMGKTSDIWPQEDN